MIESPPAGSPPGPQNGPSRDREVNEDGPARRFIVARSDHHFTQGPTTSFLPPSVSPPSTCASARPRPSAGQPTCGGGGDAANPPDAAHSRRRGDPLRRASPRFGSSPPSALAYAPRRHGAPARVVGQSSVQSARLPPLERQ